MNQEQRRYKKGVSLFEVIIAMALIVFISATSIGVMGVFNSASVRNADKVEAMAMVENVQELFLYAETQEEFEDLLPAVADIEINNKENKYIYTFSEVNYNGYFQVSYDTKAGVAAFSALLKDANNRTLATVETFEKTIPIVNQTNQ